MSQGIGILGFQGDVSEHIGIIKTIARKHKKNIPVTEIRKKDQLDNVSGLIIPGGESTTMYKLLNLYGIYDEVISKAMNGFPVMGTCAGLIVISKETNDSRVKGMNLIDTTIERNAYGRQIDSFIHKINISGIGEYKAV
ncbi:MAG: pyridoxal 5'-phosphate synthase glutaminase subunit PdxT, partial [Candidatus Thermoplasmatota archaeon]|nr:pyridoxal 5'-phosphate synthase glutaminase subunit PdxT [Candidatus Thermoplasmatota archaeon]